MFAAREGKTDRAKVDRTKHIGRQPKLHGLGEHKPGDDALDRAEQPDGKRFDADNLAADESQYAAAILSGE